MEDAVPVSLLHPGMNVITRVAQFSDLLRQKFHTLGGVAEYNTLIDLQL
jgi:hypothetical protein